MTQAGQINRDKGDIIMSKALPTQAEMLALIKSKPNHGLLIVALTNAEAVAVHKFIGELFLSDKRLTSDSATGLHRIMKNLADEIRII